TMHFERRALILHPSIQERYRCLATRVECYRRPTVHLAPSTSTSSQSRLSVKKTAYLTVQTTSSSTQKAPMIFPSIPTAIRSRTSTISTPRRITTSSPLDRMPDSESHSDRLKIQRG